MRSQAIIRFLLLASVSVAAACGGSPTDDATAIDRQTFIDAYVDLRVAALQADDFVVPIEERDAILARHGLDADDMLRFADVHGRDVDFMNGIWAEVEQRIEDEMPSGA